MLRVAAAETVEDISVQDGIFFGIMRWGARGLQAICAAMIEGGAETFGGKWLAQNAIIAVKPGRRRGAHGEEQSPWRCLAKSTRQLRAAETGHENVGEDTVGRIRGGKFEGLGTAVGLRDDTPFRFQQHRSDCEADWIVIDGEDTSGSEGEPGIHVGSILHTDCDGFTLHLHCFNGIFATSALVS